jgi:uncharacterized protein YcbX
VAMRVVGLGFTSVKGMAHVARPQVELTSAGPRRDRVFCLVDDAGEVLRTARDDVLMACQATWKPPVLMIETPIGAAPGAVGDATAGPAADVVTASYWGRPVELAAVAGPWSALLTEYLGRPVRLCRVPAPGTVVWSGSVSVVTTSSLDEVAQRVGRQSDDGARFRPTAVIDTGDALPFVEDSWAGRTLRVGAAVVRIDGPMPRCAVVNRRPAAGGPDADVLAALSADRVQGSDIMFGVHGDVVRPGRVGVGDAAELVTDSPAPALR